MFETVAHEWSGGVCRATFVVRSWPVRTMDSACPPKYMSRSAAFGFEEEQASLVRVVAAVPPWYNSDMVSCKN